MCQPHSARANHPQPSIPPKAMPLISQAYVEKYKFTSVVAQDLLDSFLSFFPELKEQSVDCRAGEATYPAQGLGTKWQQWLDRSLSTPSALCRF